MLFLCRTSSEEHYQRRTDEQEMEETFAESSVGIESPPVMAPRPLFWIPVFGIRILRLNYIRMNIMPSVRLWRPVPGR